ncbi:hypothetical protein EON79_20790 [bacterium]|nr:MAG: hypothetical protein EON79_20790 [bacterium]
MKKNTIEWTVFGLSLTLVLAAFAALGRDYAIDKSRPPTFEVRLETPEAVGSGWRVPFTVRNSGDTTAEMVKVEARSADRQEASADLDYVPRGAERTGAFNFERRPEAVSARITGYQEP